MLACLVGVLYYHLYFLSRAASIVMPLGAPMSFSGIVVSEPGHSAKTEYFDLRLLPPFRGKIRVVALPDSGFQYGDELVLKGEARPGDNEREPLVSIFPRIERVGSGRGATVRQALFDLKRKLLETFPRYLPAEESAFLGGITLGARSTISPDFSEALAASGTTHLVALSGYNIAILIFVVFGGCLRFLARRSAFYITTAVILVFVMMVGAEPSVVRAAAMGWVALLAREIGRPYGLPYALIWTAFLMVLFNPGALFMPGFQLSFMSLLGIVYLSPVILGWLGGAGASAKESPMLATGFRGNAALTISAQLAAAPIVLDNFASISLTSFMANALILPFMPITMFFGFVLLACGLAFPPLGILVGLASRALLSYEIGVIKFFAAFALPVTTTIVGLGIVVYYLPLAILARRHWQKMNQVWA